MINNKFLNKLETILLSYWNGKQKLWKAFWLMGFVFQLVLGYFLFLLLYLGTYIGLTWSIKIVIFLISNIYTIWILVSIWNCAYNVKHKIKGYIARVIVVLNIILLFLIYTGLLNIDYQNIVKN